MEGATENGLKFCFLPQHRRPSPFLLFEILKMSKNKICLGLLLLMVSGCEGDAHGTFDASISAKILTVREIENLFYALSIPFDS